MRLLILTDIHGNLPALRAVLATPQAAACDRIVSCGDHTGFGPEPEKVQRELARLGAVLLAGNHEERLLQAESPAFDGYNWTLLRWTRRRLGALPIAFPRTLRLGPILLAHGVPEDPNKLLDAQDLPVLLDTLPGDVRLFVSGHNHIPWLVSHGGRTAFNPGSLGILEDGVGAAAAFGVVEVNGGDCAISRFAVPYDLRAVARAYWESGAAQTAPEISRMALHTMRTGDPQAVLRLVRLALDCAAAMGTTLADPRALRRADALWPWEDHLDAAAFWQRIREEAP